VVPIENTPERGVFSYKKSPTLAVGQVGFAQIIRAKKGELDGIKNNPYKQVLLYGDDSTGGYFLYCCGEYFCSGALGGG
jgi:hypothetical protein